MTDDSERNEVRRLAADLHEKVLRAREAAYKTDVIRRVIARLVAKVE